MSAYLAYVLVALTLSRAIQALPGVIDVIKSDYDAIEAKMHPELPAAVHLRNSPNASNSPFSTRIPAEEATQAYWLSQGKAFVQQQANYKPKLHPAKNLILFVGAGMGLATLAATRSYIGGEAQQLAFERFPITALAKTYALDSLVGDAASTATALLSGIKTNTGVIGLNGHAKRGDCHAVLNAPAATNLAHWALTAQKAAGVVTTASLTDATAAAFYAQTAERAWQNDAALAKDCGEAGVGMQDIAMQLIHGDTGSRLKVMLGGGQRNFQPAAAYNEGLRQDGRNLVTEFLQLDQGNRFVNTSAQLLNISPKTTGRLFGTFASNNLAFHLEDAPTQPTLSEMTAKALEMLQVEPAGYVLLVEGGNIDLAHHDNKARLALDETAEFSKAVGLARAMTNVEDTLIVVTADHSHTFSLAGYQPRGSDIFGPAKAKGTDGQPYLALSYANGPAFADYFDTKASKRIDPLAVLTGNAHDRFPVTVPLAYETHGGEDVPVFASGPWEQLFSGVYEQNVVPHLMAYAACIGDGLKACV